MCPGVGWSEREGAGLLTLRPQTYRPREPPNRIILRSTLAANALSLSFFRTLLGSSVAMFEIALYEFALLRGFSLGCCAGYSALRKTMLLIEKR